MRVKYGCSNNFRNHLRFPFKCHKEHISDKAQSLRRCLKKTSIMDTTHVQFTNRMPVPSNYKDDIFLNKFDMFIVFVNLFLF